MVLNNIEVNYNDIVSILHLQGIAYVRYIVNAVEWILLVVFCYREVLVVIVTLV